MRIIDHIRALAGLGLVCLLSAATACSTSPDVIDLHDPIVPIQSRRLVADGQDAVSIARARLDDARRALDGLEDWQWDIVNTNQGWPADGNARGALRTFATARLALAKKKFEFAEARLELAEAKYELTLAQTAVRHDLATYELEPFLVRTEEAREDITRIKGELVTLGRGLDEVTSKWWAAYGSFVKGGGSSKEFYAPLGDQ